MWKFAQESVDNVDKSGIEQTFCAICQVDIKNAGIIGFFGVAEVRRHGREAGKQGRVCPGRPAGGRRGWLLSPPPLLPGHGGCFSLAGWENSKYIFFTNVNNNYGMLPECKFFMNSLN